jgi:hypothetical protein
MIVIYLLFPLRVCVAGNNLVMFIVFISLMRSRNKTPLSAQHLPCRWFCARATTTDAKRQSKLKINLGAKPHDSAEEDAAALRRPAREKARTSELRTSNIVLSPGQATS